VNVTSSPFDAEESEAYGPKNIASLSENNRFYSGDTMNPWVCYDFGHMTLKPNAYAIRSSYCGFKGGGNPKSWVIETSMDGEIWREIDRRMDSNELNGKNLVQGYAIEKSEECRYIRMKLIDKNHYGSSRLVISSFEVFGTLYE
jgi:hypothetical protein